jgi:uncharacterized protein (DUF2267 family)
MRYIEFVNDVEERAAGGLDHEQAQRAIRATLATLAEYVSAKETRDLAAQLPRELKPMLAKRTSAGEPFPPKEFVRRVAAREQLSASEAFDRTRAVFDVLAEAVTAGELEDVLAELPDECKELFKAPATRAWPDEHVSPVHAQRGRIAGRIDPD